VEVEGIDEDGFAYKETRRIAVDPATGQDIVKPKYKADTFDTTPAPVSAEEQSAIDAETAAFEAEFDAQQDGQST